MTGPVEAERMPRGSAAAGSGASAEGDDRAVHPLRMMNPPSPRASLETAPEPGAHPRERSLMAIGPVQLIVLGFSHPEFHGEIKAEIERLRQADTIRVIDSLAVHKDAQ